METFSPTFAVAFITLFSLQVAYGQDTELEIIHFEEDRTINLTIRFNQSVTEKQNDDYYVIEVRTRLSDGGAEYEGRIVHWNNTCTVTYQKSLRCVTKMGPVELYRQLNQSHVETEWTWTWKDNNSGKLKTNRWRKKLSGKSYFDRDITLVEFAATEMIFSTLIEYLLPVAFLLGYVAVIQAALLLAYTLLKEELTIFNWMENKPQGVLSPEKHEEGIILERFTTAYNRLRRRWTNRVSIHSEGHSEGTRKEALPKNELGKSEVEESPKMSSNGDGKELDETQENLEKMDCTRTTTKHLDLAIWEDEPRDLVVEASEVSSNTDESETSQSKEVSLNSEGDSGENREEDLTRNEPKEFDFQGWLQMPSKTCNEEMEDTQWDINAVKEEEKPALEDESAERELRFLLVGKTGVGKSSTGNTILGKELFHTSPGFNSETTECQTHVEDVGKWKVEITDSPGLFDTSLTEDNIAIKIVQAVACLHPGPHAFLFVIRISRFTDEEKATYRRLKAIFDEDVTKHMVIVFTGGDCLLEKGTDIVNMIAKAPAGLRDILNTCRERYVVFDNNATDKNSQVTRLLQIVEKMVKENNSPRYVCPKYMQISTQIENEIQKRLMAVQQREDEHKLYIIQLKTVNKLLLRKAENTENELRKREQHLKELKESMENKMKELEEKLRQKILSGEDMEKEMEKIVKENELLGKELKIMQEKEQQQLEEIDTKTMADIAKIFEDMIDKRLRMDYLTRTDFRNRSAQNEEGFLRRFITADFSRIIADVWKVICSISNPNPDRDPVKEIND